MNRKILQHLRDPHDTSLKYKLKMLSKSEVWCRKSHHMQEVSQMLYLAICVQLKDEFRDYLEEWPTYIQEDIPKTLCELLLIHHYANEWDVFNHMLLHTDRIISAAVAETRNQSEPYACRPSIAVLSEKLFADSQKLCLYAKSLTFFEMINFVMHFFVHMSDRVLSSVGELGPTDGLQLARVQLLARGLNFYMNNVFQFPAHVRERYVVDFMSARSPSLPPAAWRVLQDGIRNHDSFPTFCKNFVLMNRFPMEQRMQHKWKQKNAVVPSILSDISERTRMALNQTGVVKRLYHDLFFKTLYVNIRGWAELCVSEYERNPARVHFPLDDAILLLQDCNFWMEKKANVGNWIDDHVILRIDRKWKGQLSRYPKIVDMSRGEWGIVYRRRIYISTFPQVMQRYKDILMSQHDSSMCTDSSEMEVGSIPTFLRTEDFQPTYAINGNLVEYQERRRRVTVLRLEPQTPQHIDQLATALQQTQIDIDQPE